MGALAAHLIEAHAMAGGEAMVLARTTASRGPGATIERISPLSPKETPMVCKNCGGDHRSDNKVCPKKNGAAPTAAKKRKAITKNHPRPKTKASDN